MAYTQQELKDAVTNAGREITLEKEIGKVGNYAEYRVQTVHKDGGTMQSGGFHYFKHNDKDECYFQGSKPSYLQTEKNTARDEIENYISSKIEDGTVEHASIEDYNQKSKRALVEYVNSDGTGGKATIKKDSNGNWVINKL